MCLCLGMGLVLGEVRGVCLRLESWLLWRGLLWLVPASAFLLVGWLVSWLL